MSWLDRLAAELQARGVTGSGRERILLELRDHIASEPGCEDRLGDPAELAGSFAEELATARARGSALVTFGALAIAAAVLALSQLAIHRIGGLPGYQSGIWPALVIVAAVGIVVASQVALVAGVLAALRAARRRHAQRLPAAEIDLIARRTRVALVAGVVTLAGLALYLVDLSRALPGWYLGLIGGGVVVAVAALCLAFKSLSRARTVVSGRAGAAGDVYDDVPLLAWSWLRDRPWRLGVVGSLTVGLVATGFVAHAESSLIEGLERGIAEALAAAIGFALLGGAVGLLPASPSPSPDQAGEPDDPGRLRDPSRP